MCDRARLQADDERIARDRVVQLREEMADRNAREDRDERQQQEREGDGGGQPEHRREQRPHFFFSGGTPNPARCNSVRPRFDSTFFTNAVAAALGLTTASS